MFRARPFDPSLSLFLSSLSMLIQLTLEEGELGKKKRPEEDPFPPFSNYSYILYILHIHCPPSRISLLCLLSSVQRRNIHSTLHMHIYRIRTHACCYSCVSIQTRAYCGKKREVMGFSGLFFPWKKYVPCEAGRSSRGSFPPAPNFLSVGHLSAMSGFTANIYQFLNKVRRLPK